MDQNEKTNRREASVELAAASPEPICVMAYSHDGFGLGHLRRNTNISTCLVRDFPTSNVLLLVGCPPGAFFGLPTGIDFIKIPSIVKVGAGVYRPLNLRISLRRMKALRLSMIEKAAEMFKPDLFLVDHAPTGVWAELLPTLRMLRERKEPPRIVLGMRDIIDAPETVREQWRREDMYEVIGRYYDEILIYGCTGVFNTASAYGLDAELPGKFRYCGYVCSGDCYQPADEMRGRLHVSKEKLVVVIGGGGGDAYPMLRACLGAFELLGRAAPFEVILIAGPLMGAEQKKCLESEAGGLGVLVASHVYESLNYVNAADLVITMGGYNSLVEVLRLRKKSLVIPRPGPRAEQIMRTKLFAERGLIDMISPHDLSAEKLADRLMADLERDDYPVCDEAIKLNGAAQAASRLAQLLGERIHESVA